jgi:diacylglycerol kinase (ATP)
VTTSRRVQTVALVVNPTSGRRRGEEIARVAQRRMQAVGLQVRIAHGRGLEQVRAGLSELLDAGADTVVVVGGDGALHGVMDLLVAADATIGLLPAGTGNDTARALGIPVKDPVAALEIVLAGHSRRIDLARTGTGAWVTTVVASGFDSKVNERANAMTWPRGNMRYNIAIAAELRAFSPLAFRLELDGHTIEREAMLVAVGNGPSFGGGLRIAEGAVLDDGLLDVCIINPVSKAKLVRVFPRLRTGSHVMLPEFERHLVRRVTLESPGIVAYGDGERLGPLPATVEVVPGAVSVLTPQP